jgi:glucokinase
MILAGDIGGTKTVLALFEGNNGDLRLVRDGTFPSRAHATFEEILSLFLGENNPLSLRAACFGVAGAVLDGKVHTTNLPWLLDERNLAQAVRAPRAKLLNDLEAAAYGMLFLRPEELHPLNPKAPPRSKGNVAVIAAGTGLGEAILYWDGQQYHPLASEGGHADFAPRTDQEIDLLRYLRNKFGGHVSCERVLSGPGLGNIFSFLRETGKPKPTPELLEKIQTAPDPNPVIGEAALAGTDPVCVEAIDLFLTLYGAEAGNLALKCVAVGGVYIGGGIAPQFLPLLERGYFLAGFTDKGRFRALMETMPINVALNPRAPLLGAAHYAAQML